MKNLNIFSLCEAYLRIDGICQWGGYSHTSESLSLSKSNVLHHRKSLKSLLFKVAAIFVLLFTLGVGQMWAASGAVQGGYIYFDELNSGYTGAGDMQFWIGHSTYSCAYSMSKITNTKLWYCSANTTWGDATYFAFTSGCNGWGAAGEDYYSRIGSNTWKSGKKSSYTLYGSSYYVFKAASTANKADVGSDTPYGYKGTAASSLNSTQTFRTQVSTDGGSSYSNPATAPASLSYTSNTFGSATACSTSSTGSITAGNSTVSVNKSAGFTAKTDITYSSMSSDYTFVCWHDGSSSVGTGTTYTYYPTEAKTITARFTRNYIVGSTIYLHVNSTWKNASGLNHFAAYFYGAGGNTWVSCTQVGTSDYYTVTVPSGNWGYVIFVALNNASNNWSYKVYQTDDLMYNASYNGVQITGGNNSQTLEAVATATITGTYHYFPGETISLTAIPMGNGATTPTYQWYHGGTANGNAIAGATSATYTKASCTYDDMGAYYCKVTWGGNAHWADNQTAYNLKMLHLWVNGSRNGDPYDDVDFTKVDGTTATATVHFGLLWTYGFSIGDGCGNYYGNTGSMTATNHTNWTMNSDVQCEITSTNDADYTFTVDYSDMGALKVSVAYPEGDQAAGKTIYFDNNVLKWANVWYRIGRTNHSASTQMTKVPGTALLYQVTTAAYQDFASWFIAIAQGGTGDNKSIYNTKNTPAIEHATQYKGVPVTAAAVTVTPGTDHSTGGTEDNNNCEFYSYTITDGMKTDAVTISPYSNGTITVNYVNTSDVASSFTSGTENLAHTVKLTSITAVANTGYDASAITINGGDYSANYIVTGATTVAASFTPHVYTITYKDLGNNTFSGSHASGYPTTHTYATATTLKTATKTGYTFGGWYTSSDCSGTAVTTLGATAYTSNITLYAKWTQNITLNQNGATTSGSTSLAATYRAVLDASGITNPSKTNYTFAGWTTGSGGSGSVVINASKVVQTVASWTDANKKWIHAGASTLYAKWTEITHTVSVVSGGNGTVSPASVTGVGVATASGDITATPATGYYFTGWTLPEGVTAADGYSSTSNPIRINATADSKTITANFALAWSVVGDGAIGWTVPGTNKIGNISTNAGVTTGYVDISLAARTTYELKLYDLTAWGGEEDKYVGYASNAIQSSPITYANSGTAYALNTYPGYNFAFRTAGAGTYRFTRDFTNNKLTITYPATAYTVTYDGNGSTGGTLPATEYYNTGETVTVAANSGSLAKSNYNFGGWNTVNNGSGTNYTAGSGTFTISGNTTLYAKWTQSVTLNGNGGSGGSGSVTMTLNSASHGAITNPSKSGYNFGGWTSSAGSGSLVMNTSGTLQANVSNYTGASGIWTRTSSTTLYAKWTQNITLNQNGATTSGSTSLAATYNGVLDASGITNPSKTNYTFAGWTTGQNSGSVVISSGKVVTASVTDWTDSNKKWIHAGTSTLYAKWTENTHTVNVAVSPAAGGSTNVSSVSGVGVATASGTITATANPGYYFTSWTIPSGVTLASGTTSSASITINATADGKTITANFAPIWTVSGSMDDPWNTTSHQITNITASDGVMTSGYVDITLAANTDYEFKIVNLQTNAWWGSSTASNEINYSNKATAKSLASGGANNQKLRTATAGTYRFTWDVSNSKVTITYPHTAYLISMYFGTEPTIGNFTATTVAASAIGGTISSAVGSVTGALQVDGAHGTQYVKSGETVTFTHSAANSGYSWDKWGSAYDAAGRSITAYTNGSGGVTINDGAGTMAIANITANKSVYAFFKENVSTITVTTANSNYGDLKIGGAASSWGSTISLGSRTTQTIKGEGKNGYMFTSWALSGAATKASGNLTDQQITIKGNGTASSSGTATASFAYGYVVRGSTYADNEVLGGMPGWGATDSYLVPNLSTGVGTYTATLNRSTRYKFKVYFMEGSGYWWGTSETSDISGGTSYTLVGGNNDITFTSGAAGTYTFTYNFSTRALTVTYPTAYSVTYYGNGSTGGSVPTDATPYASGETVSVSGNTGSLVKSNYTLSGWNTTEHITGTTYSSAGGASFTITANTNLYAKWTQTISLDREGATTGATSLTATYNSSTLSGWSAPSKTGYDFGGYWTGDNGTGTMVINTSGVLQANVSGYTGAGGIWTSSEARTLYAKWTAKKYTVTVQVNTAGYGTVSTSSITNVPYGSTFSTSSNTFTINGTTVTASPTAATAQYTYAFSSWTNASGTVTGNVTVTANFTRTLRSYTIRFLNYDGSVLQSSSVNYGSTPSYASTPTKPTDATYTYTFTGWSPAIASVTGAQDYTAQYSSTYNVASVHVGAGAKTYFTTLADAFDNAEGRDNAVITILRDITGQTALTYDVAKTCTLDLNNHQVKGAVSTKLLEINNASADFTITDNSVGKGGELYNENSGEATYYGVYLTAGTLKLLAGKVYAKNTKDDYASLTTDAKKCTATGVHVPSGQNFQMSGGEVEGEAIYLGYGVVTAGTTTISGGTIHGKTSKFTTARGVVSSGSTTITGGTIKATAYTSTAQGIYVNGSTTNISSGDSVIIESKTTTNKTAYGIYVNKGTFNANTGCKLRVSVDSYSSATYGVYVVGARTANINDGKFIVKSATSTAYGIYSSGATTVNGGTFNVSTGTSSTAYGIYTDRGTVTVNNTPNFSVRAGTKTAYGVYATGLIPAKGAASRSTGTYDSSVTINGGTFTISTGSAEGAYGAVATRVNKVIYSTTNDSIPGNYARKGSIIINDGVFDVTSATTTSYGVWCNSATTANKYTGDGDNAGSVTATPTLTVSGGKFKMTTTSDANATAYAMNTSATNANMLIQGGYYSSKKTGASTNIESRYTHSGKASSLYRVFALTNAQCTAAGMPNGSYKVAQFYTIAYDKGSASGATGDAVTDYKAHDDAITLRGATYTRTGYTQTAWNTNSAGTGGTSKALSASYTLNAALTLYPTWTANEYTVTFDKESGSGGDNSVTATYAADMPTVTPPTRTGYTFGGYWDGDNGTGTQYYNANGTSARTWDKTSATTLYAKWTINTYTVTVQASPAGYGTVSSTSITSVPYGTAVSTSTNTLTVAGKTPVTATPAATTAQYTYAFDNWSNVPATVTGNVTITANFTRTENVASVTINSVTSYYTTMSAAWTATTGSTTYPPTLTILKDVTITGQLSYATSQTCTLDLNGHTITSNTDKQSPLQVNKAGATFIITDGTVGKAGKLLMNTTYAGDIWGATAKAGTLRLEAGTIEISSGSQTPAGVSVANGATFTMNGGTIHTTTTNSQVGRGIYSNGTATINGGTVIVEAAGNAFGIDYVSNGVTTVNGGKFNITSSGATPYITDRSAANNKVVIQGGYYNIKTYLGTCVSAPYHEFPVSPALESTYNWKVAEGYTLTWTTDGDALTGDYTSGMTEVGATIVRPNTPTKTGYTFSAWSPTPAATMPAANTTYTATWTANTNTAYTVKHYKQKLDGTYAASPDDTDNLTGTTGASVTPDRKSYTGFTAPAGQTVTILADGSRVVTYNYTRNSYTLAWALAGGSATGGTAAGSVKYGASLTAPTVTKTGYTFSAWSPSVPGTMPASNSTYTATWTAKNYTVTLNDDSGSGGSGSKSVTYNATTNLTSNVAVPTKDGYTFGGYYTAQGGSGSQLINSSGAWIKDVTNYTGHSSTNPTWVYDGSITIYAKWTQNITLNQNGATTDGTTSLAATYNAVLSASGITSNPSKTGYTFGGWTTGQNSGSVVINASKVVTASVTDWTDGSKKWIHAGASTLYAKWTINNYTVTYSAPTNGNYTIKVASGTASSASKNADYGQTITIAATPSTGYHFVSWTITKTSDGTDVTSTLLTGSKPTTASTTFTMPAYGVTVVATFAIDTYAISYAAGTYGSGSLAGGTKTYGVAYTLSDNSSAFTRTGYTYDGWSTAAAGSSKNYNLGGSYTTNAAQTFYPHWVVTNYTIGYTLNGGTVAVDNPTSYTVESAAITLNNPTKTGYTFAGWTGTGLAEATTTVTIAAGSTGNRSYTATWTPNTNTAYTVNHYKQKLDGTYPASPTETDNLTGTTGASVTPAVKSYTGFTAPSTQTVTILADGSRVVTYNYTRKSYTLTWSTDGDALTGSYTSGSTKYEAPITAPNTPTKANYVFAGWDNGSGVVTPATTMPAANTTYTATWTAAVASVTENTTTTYYATVADAITAANGKSSPTVTMLQNASVTSEVTITAAMTINLNGKTVSSSLASATGVFKINAASKTVTIKDTSTGGTIAHTASYNGYIYGINIIAGSLTLQSGTISATNNTAANDSYRGIGIFTNTSAEGITISGGTITASSKNMSFGIYTNNTCNLTMTGGTITASGTTKARGIYVKGTTSLSGATITATATGENSYAVYGKQGSLTINSGTYTASATGTGYAVGEEAGTVAISGGSFNGATKEFSKTGGTASITGGYYVHDTDIESNCASSYHVFDLAGQSPYLYEVAEGYTLTWNLAGGSISSAGTPAGYVKVGATVTAPTVTKTGYTFASWSPAVVSPMPAADKTYTAQWTANSYTITYKDKGNVAFSGTHVDTPTAHPTSHTYGTATTLNSATKTGYIFDGWYTTSACTGDAVTSIGATAYTANFTLYAKWTPITYSVRFNKNDDAATGTMSNQGFTYDVAQNLTSNAFTKTGYSFAGWATSAGGSVVHTDGKSVSNLSSTQGAIVDLYAKWTANNYSITYYDLGSTSFTGSHASGYPTSHTYGTATALKSATKDGYTFGGWYISSACTGSAVTSLAATGYTANITLYAKWTQSVKLHDNNGDSHSGSATATFNAGGPLSVTAPTREGYTVEGYYAEAGCTHKVMTAAGALVNYTGYVVSSKWIHSGATTLYAKWTEDTHTVTVAAGANGSASPASVTAGIATASGSITATPNTGYHFDNWTIPDGVTIASGSTTSATITIRATADDLTITANFAANTNTAYTVKHYKQKLDGTYAASPDDTDNLTGTTGASVTPDRKSYTGFTAPAGQTVTILADGSRVVEYKYTRNSYTLAWALDGGSISTPGTAAGSVKYGASLTAPTVTKTGYNFASWSPSVPATMPAANSTYTATWTENSYTITFKNGGHGTVKLDGTTIANNGTASVNQVTTKTLSVTANTGYTFAGWTKTGGVVLANASATSTNITATATGTVTATWTANEYSITYKDQGGADFSGTHGDGYPTSHTYGTATALVSPTKTGYTFGGWYTTSACTGDAVTSLGATAYTANITLYAKWTINNYTVTIVKNENSWGTVSASSITSVPYGTAVSTSTNTLTVTGKTPVTATPAANTAQYTYAFSSWSNVPATVTGDVTITANFTRTVNQYTITWKSEDGTSTLETDANQNYGATTAFNGSTPTKAATAQYTYTFDGWATSAGGDKAYNIGSTPTVSGNATYYAHFSATVNNYTVTIVKNENSWGTVSASSITSVPYGTAVSTSTNTLTVTGKTPVTATPAATSEGYTYAFENWTGVPATVTGNVTITANFTRTGNVASVTVGGSTTYYTTIDAAWEYVNEQSSDMTIKILQDITGISSSLVYTPEAAVKCTLNLNNHLVKGEVSTALLDVNKTGGTFVITDESVEKGGELYNEPSGEALYYGAYLTAGTLKLQAGKVHAKNTSDDYASLDANAKKCRAYGIYVAASQTFEMSGGEIEGEAIYIGYGLVNAGSATISGGTIHGKTSKFTTAAGVYSSGTTNISGGTIKATAYTTTARGLYVAGGTTNINSGDSVIIESKTTSTTAYGIYHTSGTFNAKPNCKLRVSVESNSNTAYGIFAQRTVNIDGGKFFVTAKGNTAYGILTQRGTTTVQGNPEFTVKATTKAYGVAANGTTPSATSTGYSGTIKVKAGTFNVETTSSTIAYGAYAYAGTGYSQTTTGSSTPKGNYIKAGIIEISGGEFNVKAKTNTAYGIYVANGTKTNADAGDPATAYGKCTISIVNGNTAKFKVTSTSDANATAYAMNTTAENTDLVVEGGYYSTKRTSASSTSVIEDKYTAPEKDCNYTVEATTAADIAVVGDIDIYKWKVGDFTNIFEPAAASGVWSVAANWTKGVVPTIETYATIKKPCTVDIEHAVAKSVVIDQNGNTGKLTIQANKGLEVAGTITKTTNGSNSLPTTVSDLVLESSSAGNASLIFNNSNSDAATVAMYSKGNIDGEAWNWQFIGMPFTTANALYTYYGSYLYKWVGGAYGWDVVPNGGTMEPFTGYCITQDAPTTYVMEGTLNPTIDYEKSISVTAGEELVIGNSWTAPIFVSGFNNTTLPLANKTIYLFNTGFKPLESGGAEEHTGDKFESGTYVTVPIHSAPYTGDDLIAPMQGFYVDNTGGSAATITLSYNDLVRPNTDRDIVAGPMHAPQRQLIEDAEPEVMKIWINGNVYNDKLILLAREDFSTGFDNGWDGKKQGFGVVAPSIYTVNNVGEPQAVSAIPSFEGTIVAFKKGVNDVCTITFEYNGDELWYLNDLKLQTSVVINNEENYMFSADDDESDLRFIISRRPIISATTGVDNIEYEDDTVQKIFFRNHMYIIRAGRIFNVNGAVVK